MWAAKLSLLHPKAQVQEPALQQLFGQPETKLELRLRSLLALRKVRRTGIGAKNFELEANPTRY